MLRISGVYWFCFGGCIRPDHSSLSGRTSTRINGENVVLEYFYEQESLMKYISEKYNDIKPNDIPENPKEIIPEAIWNCMTNNIQKDIQELFECYYHILNYTRILQA